MSYWLMTTVQLPHCAVFWRDAACCLLNAECWSSLCCLCRHFDSVFHHQFQREKRVLSRLWKCENGDLQFSSRRSSRRSRRRTSPSPSPCSTTCRSRISHMTCRSRMRHAAQAGARLQKIFFANVAFLWARDFPIPGTGPFSGLGSGRVWINGYSSLFGSIF